MMEIIKSFILCLAVIITFNLTSVAQTNFEVPQNVEFKTKEDYIKYEPAVVGAAKWLEETDLDKETDKRKHINAFILEWVSGSPIVNLDITESLSKIYGKNNHLIAVYMAGYAGNFIQNNTSATKFSATKAGLIAMMNVYKKGIDISRSREMEKLIKMTNEGKMDGYINDNFK